MDIGGWLRSLGLEKYEAAFRENEISEKVLLRLTGDDLKELGVNALGHRRTLLDAIATLRAGSKTETQTPLAPALGPQTTAETPATWHAAGERRHVTVMFCDFVDSTVIAAKLDAEE